MKSTFKMSLRMAPLPSTSLQAPRLKENGQHPCWQATWTQAAPGIRGGSRVAGGQRVLLCEAQRGPFTRPHTQWGRITLQTAALFGGGRVTSYMEFIKAKGITASLSTASLSKGKQLLIVTTKANTTCFIHGSEHVQRSTARLSHRFVPVWIFTSYPMNLPFTVEMN